MTDLVEQIIKACEEIDRLDPKIHSFLPEPDRLQRLTKDAETLTQKYENKPKPPLFGLLVGIKDIFRVDGLPTQAGSRLPTELFAGDESVVVTRLKKAGALILGKTVSTEFAAGEPNETVNPVNHAYSPGGSSSGSAAAVAAGLCPLAIGSQTIGSTLRPASYCGIVGFKPSFGRIAISGAIDYAPSLDTVGLFAKTVQGLMPAAEVLLKDWQIPETTPRPVLGIPDGQYLTQPDREIQNVFMKTIKKLEEHGYTVKHIPMFRDIAEINETLWQVATYEMARVHTTHGWYPKYKDLYRPKTIALIEKGLAISEETYQNAKTKQNLLRKTIRTEMKKHGIDIWISPAALTYAPEMKLSFTGDPAMNIPWTFAGLPSLSLPIKDSVPLPLGLQLVGEFGEDEKLLKESQEIEQTVC